MPTFCSEVQHRKNKTGQPLPIKIVSEQPLTISQTTDMPYKHFTTEKRNQLAALLRAKVKKKNIAKQLNRSRRTIWREYKRGAGSNGRYDVRKSKRLAKEKTIKRFKRIPKEKKYTIIYDNGYAFSEHETTEKTDRINNLFCFSLSFMGTGNE